MSKQSAQMKPIQEIREKIEYIQIGCNEIIKHRQAVGEDRPVEKAISGDCDRILTLLAVLEAEQAAKDKQIDELKATVGNHQIVIDKLHIDEDAYLKQIEELTLERNGLMLTLAAANEKIMDLEDLSGKYFEQIGVLEAALAVQPVTSTHKDVPTAQKSGNGCSRIYEAETQERSCETCWKYEICNLRGFLSLEKNCKAYRPIQKQEGKE
jgi:uncharacterized coiled-coil protein SlyX